MTNFSLLFAADFQATPVTSAAKSNEKLINQKLCNSVLILDAIILESFHLNKQRYLSKYVELKDGYFKFN